MQDSGLKEIRLEMRRLFEETMDYIKRLQGDANGRMSGELVPDEAADNYIVIKLPRPLPRLAHNKVTILLRKVAM